jgi:bacillithiol biosynthesis deacetylase BshB1
LNVDVLAIGAHPDDVELGIGGLLHKLTRRGYTVAVLDLTRGEMGTRGSAEERGMEAAESARILGVAHRENAELPDGGLSNTAEQQRKIIPFIRKFQPTIILGNMEPDRHPDHAAAHALIRDANFYSGLERIETGQARHRAPLAYYYHPYYEAQNPAFIVDISEDFEAKTAALRAYASQFYNPDYRGSSTLIASKAFWDRIETRAAYWGGRIGVAYGEPLYSLEPVKLDLPPGLQPNPESAPDTVFPTQPPPLRGII